MKKALFAGISAAAFVAIAPAVAQPAPVAPAPMAAPVAPGMPRAPMMREHTRDEVVAKVREMFAKADSNRDGFVTKAEADAARNQFAGKMKERRGKMMAMRAHRMEGNPGQMFERMDTNKDGMISRAEFDAAHQARTAKRDRDGDGRPDARRMAGAMHKMHRGGMGHFGGQMFEMADVNKDGRVSLQEAQDAALRRFDMADTNRDGRISREEMMQRHQQMRAQRQNG